MSYRKVILGMTVVITGCATRTTQPTPLTVLDGPLPGMEFVVIPSGDFRMGSLLSEIGRLNDESPRRTVTIRSFQLMTTEVTQGMWEEVMGSTVEDMRNRSEYGCGLYGVGDDSPMYYVTWDDAQEFIDELNFLDPGFAYRLPTEAEWEYAARAGTTTRYYWGDDSDVMQIGNYAWYRANSGDMCHPVGQKLPNAWGLYDMIGNVWEWCQDVYVRSYDNCPTDGSAYIGPGSYGSFHIKRGGCWYGDVWLCRSASRFDPEPGYEFHVEGFRLARSAR